MQQLDSRVKAEGLLPDFISESVAVIDFAELKKQGYKQCFIDIDGTITDRGDFRIAEPTLQNLLACELPLYIATNRLDTSGLDHMAKRIGAKGFAKPESWQGKPSRSYYKHALEKYGFKAHETVMIGDRLLQDVWGANRSGLVTVFITHRFATHNSRFEHLLDRWQRWLVRRSAKLYTEI